MAVFGSQDNLPVPQVKALSDRGYAENDIKDILRKKGYTENEINLTFQKALVSKVSAKGSGILPMDQPAPQPLPPAPQAPPAPLSAPRQPALPEVHNDHMNQELQQQFGDTNSLFGSIGAKQEELNLERPSSPQTPHEDQMDNHAPESYEVDLEPIVEAIVEEKWNDTYSVVSDMHERLENLEKLTKGGTKLDEVAQVEYLAKQVQERVERLEQSLDEVSIKVNSIEKAFKQFIPSLTGNIKALSDAVRHIRLGDSENPQ